MTDPYRYFRIEARELVERLDADLLALERDPGPEPVGRLLRVAHTLKGAARVVRQPEIADVAHGLEGALTPYRLDGQVPREDFGALLAAVDRIRTHLSALDPPESRPAHGESAPRTMWADTNELDHILERTTQAAFRLAAVHRVAEEIDRAGTPNARRIARALTDALGHADRELRQAREAAERLRLVPVESIFTSLERVCRDTGQTLGRRVGFVGEGGNVRVGAGILREMSQALAHAVRNAVAHGIEPESVRVATGKPPSGTVTVRVARQGRQISFACADDGAGFDLDAVRRTAPALSTMDSERLLAVLLQGNVSTAGTVTEVSGRGIGLDAVRAGAERLGGRVGIRSTPGRGAEVEVVVPVSLLYLDVLLVEAGGQVVGLPLAAVERSVRLPAGHVVGGEVSVNGNGSLPFLHLSRLLSDRTVPPATAYTAVVLTGRDGGAVLAVDRMLGVRSVVSRPLPPLTDASGLTVGAYLDTDGTPRLVLDPDAVVASARAAPTDSLPATLAPPPILVVDDSLTTRMLEQGILEAAGYDVDVAASAEEALDRARQRRYGLFLVDVEMPGIDGVEFVRRTRADPVLSATPAVVVTSLAETADRERAIAAGASDYVVKSDFDQRYLLDRVKALLP